MTWNTDCYSYKKILDKNNSFKVREKSGRVPTLVEESIGFVQILDFRFLIDLHVLKRPEHDLTISGKCLSVCVSVCV